MSCRVQMLDDTDEIFWQDISITWPKEAFSTKQHLPSHLKEARAKFIAWQNQALAIKYCNGLKHLKPYY